jgi:hypothetical protein
MSENVATSADASTAPGTLLQMMTGYWVTKGYMLPPNSGLLICFPTARSTVTTSKDDWHACSIALSHVTCPC